MVAARQGNRETYQPLATALYPQPELLAVIRACQSVFPFRTFYIADLNAIENNGNNHALITRLLETCGELSLWVDSGSDPFISDNCDRLSARVSNVMGSETGISPAQLEHYTRKTDCVLSLDFRGASLLGNQDLPAQPSRLPERVIIMNLERVGSHAGPDLEPIRALMSRLPGKQIYAAGGVRDAGDLRLLADLGVHGALIASALHHGSVTSEQLRALQPPRGR